MDQSVQFGSIDLTIVAMALSSYNLSLATALLLLLCMTAATSGQQCDSSECRLHELSKLFEEALVNSGDALWKLQQIYFNPSSGQSPTLVYLNVWVTVNDIIFDRCSYDNVLNGTCSCLDAFDQCSEYFNYCDRGQWIFQSYPYYQLQLAFPDSSNLARLTASGSLRFIFFAFDPTFYSIMKALSSSVELRKTIKMHINTTLHDNPCWDEADSALGMVLTWVSFIIT